MSIDSATVSADPSPPSAAPSTPPDSDSTTPGETTSKSCRPAPRRPQRPRISRCVHPDAVRSQFVSKFIYQPEHAGSRGPCPRSIWVSASSGTAQAGAPPVPPRLSLLCPLCLARPLARPGETHTMSHQRMRRMRRWMRRMPGSTAWTQLMATAQAVRTFCTFSRRPHGAARAAATAPWPSLPLALPLRPGQCRAVGATSGKTWGRNRPGTFQAAADLTREPSRRPTSG
jgi:hypothetical protein